MRSGVSEKDITLPGPVHSIELSADASMLTMAHTSGVTFISGER